VRNLTFAEQLTTTLALGWDAVGSSHHHKV
jgi:hypothetical protein